MMARMINNTSTQSMDKVIAKLSPSMRAMLKEIVSHYDFAPLVPSAKHPGVFVKDRMFMRMVSKLDRSFYPVIDRTASALQDRGLVRIFATNDGRVYRARPTLEGIRAVKGGAL